MKLNGLLTFAVVLFAILAIGLIVLSAIEYGTLLLLAAIVVALGGISIWLASIGVNLFSRFTDATQKRDALRFEHIEHVMKLGYMPAGRGIYKPLELPEPPPDMPVSLQGITAEQLSEFKIHAVNLLALSKQEMGESSTQIIPYHRARNNEYFRDVSIWANAVRYLLANKMAWEKYRKGENGVKKEGTFLNAGTVGQAYETLSRA